MYYSGIDQHKASSVITTVTADGEPVARVTLPNQRGASSCNTSPSLPVPTRRWSRPRAGGAGCGICSCRPGLSSNSRMPSC
jgi:hypothetical protein